MGTRRHGIDPFCVFLLICSVCSFSPPSFGQATSSVPIPEYYGTYAVAGGKLVRLDSEARETATPRVQAKFGSRPSPLLVCSGADVVGATTILTLPEFPPDVQFLLFFQSSGIASPMMIAEHSSLGMIGYIRNVLFFVDGPGVQRCGGDFQRRALENAWDDAIFSGSVELRVKPVPGQQEMVLAVPSSKLEPGIYTLSGGALKQTYRFVVSPLSEAEKSRCTDLSVQYGQWIALSSPRGLTKTSSCTGTLEAPTPSTITGAGASNPSAAPAVSSPATACADSTSCTQAGRAALASSSWNDATAAWDKALDLGGSLDFIVCHENTFGCETGTISVGTKEVSFTKTNKKKLFAVPPSQVTPVGVVNEPQIASRAAFRFTVQGKNYNFDFLDFLPHDVTCSIPGRLLQCPPQRVAQQLAVANYVSQAIPKLASGTLGPLPTPPAATPGGSASPASSSSNPQIAEQIKKVIANYETSTFHSPLDDQQLLQLVIAESETAGVPLWLLFGQAKVETTFGSPKNVTTRDGVSFTDGSLGNAHNLFNIRPGTTWKGKVVVSPIDGPFRAYGSYEDGVRDYVRLMSGDPYKGKTLEAVINTYFPASDNSTAKVDDYITSLIQFAGVLGVTVNRNTIPVP